MTTELAHDEPAHDEPARIQGRLDEQTIHALVQPLTAMRLYTHALDLILRNQPHQQSAAAPALAALERQVERLRLLITALGAPDTATVERTTAGAGMAPGESLVMTRHHERPLIYLIDDDPDVRDGLRLALQLNGYEVLAYPDAESFLARCSLTRDGCALIDLRMPGMDGLALQHSIKACDLPVSVIFMSGAGTIPEALAAIRAGAFDFLEKPFAIETLIERIDHAMCLHQARREQQAERQAIHQRYQTLTPREREVAHLINQGLSNKAAARELNLSPRTVEHHRAQVMEKMQVRSLAELCHCLQQCEGCSPPSD